MVKKDWCTAWPDRWKDVDFSPCCKKHDEDYEETRKLEGFWKRVWKRRKDDWALSKCVWEKFKEKGYRFPIMAPVMLLGVRLFGWAAGKVHMRGK